MSQRSPAHRLVDRPATLRDCLRVPYRLEAFAFELQPGTWCRHVAYPELPDCEAEAATIEDALTQLERRRIEVITRMVRQGSVPPTPRPLLIDSDPEGLIERFGLQGLVAGWLDRPLATNRKEP